MAASLLALLLSALTTLQPSTGSAPASAAAPLPAPLPRGAAAAQAGAQDRPAYEQQLLFKLSAPLPASELAARLGALGLDGAVRRALPTPPAHMRDRVGLGRIHVLEVATDQRPAALTRLTQQPWVSWAEPNRGGHALAGGTLPDDASFGLQWCLDQPNDIDMDLPEAWALQGGFELDPLVVAVIDSGILQGAGYPDVTGLPWNHPGEIPANGLDDDGNGFVDDVFGYDFVRDDSLPDDENGHGTAVTSILAAHTDNGSDLAGVAPGVQVMVLKVFNEFGDFPVSGPYAGHLSVAAGLQYAADNGALLANNSWGVFTGFSQVVADAVQYALDNQTHLVFAAGNFDEDHFFPSEQDGLIAVAALDSAGLKSFWGFGSASNYGAWVDLSAGGSAVPAYHLAPSSLFLLNGTSMAAPNASGVAAMVLSRFPHLSREDLRSILMQSAVSVDALNPVYAKLLGAGHVNAFNALSLLEPAADLGQGLSGGSTPRLHTWGESQPGGVVTASLSGGPTTAPGGLIVGLSTLLLPFKGGVLVPTPDLIVSLTTDADGAWRLDAPLATGVPSGASIYMQVGVADGGAPKDFAFSNGVSFTGL